MTPDEIAAIRARAEKATPGPWEHDGHIWSSIWAGEDGIVVELSRIEDYDAEFIAAARTDVPALLAEVERLRAENARLRGAAETT